MLADLCSEQQISDEQGFPAGLTGSSCGTNLDSKCRVAVLVVKQRELKIKPVPRLNDLPIFNCGRQLEHPLRMGKVEGGTEIDAALANSAERPEADVLDVEHARAPPRSRI
jgi:hypothetical protein